MTTSDTHNCPGPGCKAQVPARMLMCAKHWFQVPALLRRQVWRAWRDGRGAGTTEHQQAITAAIASLQSPPAGRARLAVPRPEFLPGDPGYVPRPDPSGYCTVDGPHLDTECDGGHESDA